MKLLSRYIEALRLGAQIDAKAPPGGAAAGQNVLLPSFVTLTQTFLSATSVSRTVIAIDNVSGSFVLAGVSAVFTTASSSGTLQVESASGTTALGSGTSQLSSALSLSGTANTTVNGVLIASPTVLNAGDRLGIILAGTLTSLAGCCVTITLKRVA